MWSKILLIFFVFSFLFRTDLAFDQDLGRHLKLGEIITKTGQIPKTNLFSYTNPDFPFTNTHWLFEIVAYWFSQTLGLPAFLYLKVIIFLFSVWLVFRIIPKTNQALLLPVGFIFLHVLRERVELRPEIFSFLFTALTLFILRSNTKLIFLLPLIQLVWINTHIYFFVGLILQAIFLLPQGVKPTHLQGVLVFLLSILFSLINPNGLTGLLYPINVTKNYGYTIVENQTMFFLEKIQFQDPNFLFVKLSLGLVVVSLIIAIIKRRFEIRNILLSVVGCVLALMHSRSFPYLVFLSLPATIQNFGLIRTNLLTKILVVIFGVILISESWFYLNGEYYKVRNDRHQVGLKMHESVKVAMDFVLANDLPSPIYNNFDIGSYIIYRGYPKYQVFVDGRPEAYPKEFFQNIYIPTQADFSKFKDLEQKFEFQTIIFSHTDQTPWGRAFLQALVKDNSWKLVYIDDFMVIFLKKDVFDRKNLASVDLAELDPNSFNFTNHISYLRLGLFLLSIQNYESGLAFSQKALQLFPNSPFTNSFIFSITGQSSYLEKSHDKFFW